MEGIREALLKPAPDGFQIRNMTEFLQVQEASASALTALLAVIASISLLVGGISIMNIMLVSVTERTRESGIRAVGAKPHYLISQFLVESVTLSLVGAAIGAACGVAGPIIAEEVFNIRTELTLGAILLAAGFPGDGGHRLRLLSGLEGVAPAADRSAAL